MTIDEIKKYVEEWMDGHEPDTFIQNEHGVYLYSAGPVSINLKLFFESLLEDFIEDKMEDIENYNWILRRLEKNPQEEIVRILKLQKERKATLCKV